jgi:hypothetical protein
MASFIPATSMSWLQAMLKMMNVNPLYPFILDDTNKLMWMAAPWRWTLGIIDAVTIPVDPAGDISIGTLPADFMFGYKAWTTSTADAGIPRDLEIVGVLSDDVSVLGQPTQVQIIGTPGGAGTVRLFPQPENIAAGTKLYILYKKTAPVVNKETQGTAGVLVMPDEYVPAYNMGLLYYGYLYSNDQRAGAATIQDGKVSYSGQYAVFMSMIQQMREREKLPIDTDNVPSKKMEV